MIQANELRIGNWVQHEPYPDELWKVDYKLFESIDLQLVECVGIPLTPEILEKAGFDDRSNSTDFAFKYGEFIIGGTMSRLFPSIHGESRLEAYGNEIFYLHQLQNLYFALTGEELTINL